MGVPSVPKVRFFAQSEKHPAGVGRQSLELLSRLQEESEKVSIIPEMRKRGFELRIGRRRFGGYLSLLAAQSVPYRRGNGEITHAADWGIAPYFGDRFDILTFYDPFAWQHLDIYQKTAYEALRISLYIPRILSARVLVCPTEYVRQRILVLFNREAQVIPCGINTRDLFPRPVERKDRTALTVGSDYPRKNLAIILKACALANFRLVTVGAWNYSGSEAKAKRLAKSLKVKMTDLGYVSDEELAKLYSSCVLVSASMDEGFGLTPLEAMACGGPVVASSIPAHKETLGHSAHYFEPNDADDLAFALELAEEDRGEEMKAIRLTNARRYSWIRILPLWLDLYRSVWEARN
jgi:glycosyltransferase involved in cell wall biosynthesis